MGLVIWLMQQMASNPPVDPAVSLPLQFLIVFLAFLARASDILNVIPG